MGMDLKSDDRVCISGEDFRCMYLNASQAAAQNSRGSTPT